MSNKMHPFIETTCLIVIEWNEGRRKLSFKEIADNFGVSYNSFMDQLNIAKDSGLYDATRKKMEDYQNLCRQNPMRLSNPY